MKITERHYASWIQQWQEQMEAGGVAGVSKPVLSAVEGNPDQSCKFRFAKFWRRGESNFLSLLRTRNLLTLRKGRIDRNAKNAPVGHALGTRENSKHARNLLHATPLVPVRIPDTRPHKAGRGRRNHPDAPEQVVSHPD